MYFLKLKRTIAVVATTLLAAMFVLPVGGTVSAAPKEFDPAGTYHAALGLQTATTLWIERFGYYGKDVGGSYCPYGEENWEKLTRNFDEDVDTGEEPEDGKVVAPGTFTDAELKGNGTYTVKLENADFQKETTLSQLQIATDIPLNDQIKFTDITLTINGREFPVFNEAVMEDEEPYLEAGMVVLILNHWRDRLKQDLSNMGLAENSANGWELLNGEGDENISVTFTVSGFNYDNEEAVAPTESASESSEQINSAAASSDTSGDESENGGIPTAGIVIIVIVVIAIIGCVVVVATKKKRK